MNIKQRLVITIEKYEIKIARLKKTKQISCLTCQTETLHFTVSQVAELLAIPEIATYRQCNGNQLHANETIDGKFLICSKSIVNVGRKF